jgi:hypothetical protein
MRPRCQKQRVEETPLGDLGDRPTAREGTAKVAVQNARHPGHIALAQRAIQSEIVTNIGHRLRGARLAQHLLRDVAGKKRH